MCFNASMIGFWLHYVCTVGSKFIFAVSAGFIKTTVVFLLLSHFVSLVDQVQEKLIKAVAGLLHIFKRRYARHHPLD